MKFTNEQAFENLKGILTNNGKKPLRMSEKSLNSQLETLIALVANDETELDDFVSKVKPTFETMNGNAEKDRADFIADWESKHPTTPVTTTIKTATTDPNSTDTGNDAVIAELKKRLDDMEKKNAEREKEALISQKRNDLVAELKKSGVRDQNWLNDFLSEVTITEDMDVEEKAKTYAKIYNRGMSTIPPYVVPTTSGNSDPNAANPMKSVSNFMKQRREAEARGNIETS